MFSRGHKSPGGVFIIYPYTGYPSKANPSKGEWLEFDILYKQTGFTLIWYSELLNDGYPLQES